MHPLLALGRRHPAIGERKLDVLVHRQIADQIERLENESDLAIADARALGELQVLHRLGVQHVGAVGGRIEQAQNRQQRGFPAARRPGDGQILALLDVQMNARQRVRLHFVGLEDLGHAVHADQSCCVNRHVLSPYKPPTCWPLP